MTDTICAISTPPGLGAVAMIRVSGPKAFPITAQLLKPDFGMQALLTKF